MNSERWLVSYADFITVLFAFFVVMFASSRVDRKKMAVVAAAFDSYLNGGQDSSRGPKSPTGGHAPSKTPGTTAQALTMAELEPPKKQLEEMLKEEIAAGRVELSLGPRGLVMSLKESAFFAPGEDAISLQARPILAKVAAQLQSIPGQVRLEGHTDNTPIRTSRFPSNWQLSSARSIAVLRLLTQDLGLPAERFAVAGYGEYHPLESNEAADGRARNRRVDVVILTQAAAEMAPS